MFLYCEKCNRIYSEFERTYVISDTIKTNLITGDIGQNQDNEYVQSTVYTCLNCSDKENYATDQKDIYKIVWYQSVAYDYDRQAVVNLFKVEDCDPAVALEFIDLDKLTASQLLIVKRVFDI